MFQKAAAPPPSRFSRATFERIIRFLKPDVDPAMILAQIETDPEPPTTVQQSSQPFHAEVPSTDMEEGGGYCFDALGELRPLAGDEGVDEPYSGATQEIDHDDEIGVEKDDHLEKGEEVEQQLHAAEEVEVNPAEREETGPNEGVETNVNIPMKEETVILIDGEVEAEEVPPSIESVKPAATVVHTYQRWPAREETSEKRSEGEHPRETPGQGIGGNIESPAKRAAAVPPRRRTLLLGEEPEEEDDVYFHLIGEQHNQRQPDVYAGADDSDKERRERKRKGKTIATLAKKRLKQPSMAEVIQERDPSEVR